MSDQLSPVETSDSQDVFLGEYPLDKKREYRRLRRELGLLLKNARIDERLSAEVIARQNGWESENNIFKIERGHEKRLRRYFQLAEYYGLSFHMAAGYIDENYERDNFLLETDYAEDYFFCLLSGLLQRYRSFNTYSLGQLSRLTGIPEQKIVDIEKRKADCSIREACALLLCFGKALVPEVCRKDII